jgi:hypothetical protein
VERLLIEGRKSDSLMVQLSTNAHYDAERHIAATDKYDALCEEKQLLQAQLQDLNNIDEGVGDEGNSPSSSNAAADDGQHDGRVVNQECAPPVSSRSRARVPSRHVRCHGIPLRCKIWYI